MNALMVYERGYARGIAAALAGIRELIAQQGKWCTDVPEYQLDDLMALLKSTLVLDIPDDTLDKILADIVKDWKEVVE